MINRIAIDSDALRDHKQQSRQDSHVHQDLIRALTAHGVLELLGPNDAQDLLDAIAEMSDEVRGAWAKAITALSGLNRVQVGGEDFATRDVCHAAPLPAPLRSVDLVVVCAKAADGRGDLTSTGYETRRGEPEMALADSVTHSRTIARAQALRERGNYPALTPRDNIWTEVFAKAAQVSTEATLLDQYFLTHLLEGRSRRDRDHAEWLVETLGRDMRDQSAVRLICGWPRDRQKGVRISRTALESEAARLARFVGSSRLASVTIVLAPWPRRHNDGPHNRHLRFSGGMGITSHEGFDRLDARDIVGIDGFSWSAVTSVAGLNDLVAREAVILNHPKRMEITL